MGDLSAERRGGQVILVACIATVLIVLVGGLIQYLVVWGRSGASFLLARLCLIALLCYYLYRGSRVARWLAVAVFSLNGLVLLLLSAYHSSWDAGLVAGQGVFCLGFAAVLVVSFRVSAFLAYQRWRRRLYRAAGHAGAEPGAAADGPRL